MLIQVSLNDHSFFFFQWFTLYFSLSESVPGSVSYPLSGGDNAEADRQQKNLKTLANIFFLYSFLAPAFFFHLSAAWYKFRRSNLEGKIGLFWGDPLSSASLIIWGTHSMYSFSFCRLELKVGMPNSSCTNARSSFGNDSSTSESGKRMDCNVRYFSTTGGLFARIENSTTSARSCAFPIPCPIPNRPRGRDMPCTRVTELFEKANPASVEARIICSLE